uniref:Uncharacterized protein n=1 Tax=Chromera velia CCMP2878 TaxID=1169474 RepID=A0A0G4HY59_9ALVE|eukprot:Cvel_33430.t1-p1 / transcript=Cvel_33430.t1 / gene=Cvel_33430 / organism=Chromera_velia_CCMP2878 / gene_product=hypothetical protein / transcript_product=hypothetical protein / location=Cvel_scaffold5426:3841-4056(-) / protein_length=72 / sequence_SO=supercontig / SO=protein_coding / is_pseudo=false
MLETVWDRFVFSEHTFCGIVLKAESLQSFKGLRFVYKEVLETGLVREGKSGNDLETLEGGKGGYGIQGLDTR